MSESNTELEPCAAYGNLPFDRFVLDHWDYTKPKNQDQGQWDDLAQRWMSMNFSERAPYWKPDPWAWTAAFPTVPIPTKEQIERVLAPHQTINERNVSLQASCQRDPIWIRTCYADSLKDAYEDMVSAYCDASPEGPELVLQEEYIYGNLGGDLTRILLRVPMIVDASQHPSTGFEDETSPPAGHLTEYMPEDPAWMPLYYASLKDKFVVYLLNEEALREKLLKVIFLDLYGNVVWTNKMRPDDATAFERVCPTLGGRLYQYFEFMEMAPSLKDPGTLHPHFA